MEPVDVVFVMLYGFPIGSLILMGALKLWILYLERKEKKKENKL